MSKVAVARVTAHSMERPSRIGRTSMWRSISLSLPSDDLLAACEELDSMSMGLRTSFRRVLALRCSTKPTPP